MCECEIGLKHRFSVKIGLKHRFSLKTNLLFSFFSGLTWFPLLMLPLLARQNVFILIVIWDCLRDEYFKFESVFPDT